MKKYALTFIVLLFAISSPRAAAFGAEELSVEAQGAALMDFETGRVLWEKGGHKKLAMASTTKIMTSILALELGSADDVVTVTKRAAAAPPVKMGLTAGEKISLGSLLYALMLQSSNDAAVAIAEHIGGSVENFCALMNAKARELGALDTTFETPNGLDSENHISTACDMALITRYALGNKDFVKLVNASYATARSDKRSYDISNKNKLLSEYEGANGVKTGYTGKAGHCFVGAAQRNGMQLVSVVLASGWGERGKRQKWTDTKKILDYGFDNYRYYDLINADEKAVDITILRTKTPQIPLAYGEGLRLPLTSEEKEALSVSIELEEGVKAPVSEGDRLGRAVIGVNGEELAVIDLVAGASAERHDLKSSIEKAINAFLGITTETKPGVVIPEWYYSE